MGVNKKWILPAFTAILLAACALIATGQMRERPDKRIPVDLNATLTNDLSDTSALHGGTTPSSMPKATAWRTGTRP